MKNGTPMHTYYRAWLEDAASHARGPNMRDAFRAGWNGRQDADNRAREIGYQRTTPFPVDPKVFFADTPFGDLSGRRMWNVPLPKLEPGQIYRMDPVKDEVAEAIASGQGFTIRAEDPPERRGSKVSYTSGSMYVKRGARLFIQKAGDDKDTWTEIGGTGQPRRPSDGRMTRALHTTEEFYVGPLAPLTDPLEKLEDFRAKVTWAANSAFPAPPVWIQKSEASLMLDVLKDRYERKPGGYGGGDIVRHIFRPEDFLGSNVFHESFVGCVRLKFNPAWQRLRAKERLGTVTLHGCPETSINVEWSVDTEHEERGRKFGALFNTNDRDKIFKVARSVQLTMEPRRFRIMHISILL